MELFERDDLVFVFDTGPLFTVSLGLPSKILVTASFIQNDYKKAKKKAKDANTTVINIPHLLREDFVEQLDRREMVGDRILKIIEYCMLYPRNCVIPQEVFDELSKYQSIKDIRDLIRLLGTQNTRTGLVAEFNWNMRRIGHDEYSKHPRTINPTFFENLVGYSLNWNRPNLRELRYLNPEYKRWYDMLKAFSLSQYRGLSDTDVSILAYTAYLNSKKIPAVAVIGDNLMKRVALFYGIPIFYIYDGKIYNETKLGNLGFRFNGKRGRKRKY